MLPRLIWRSSSSGRLLSAFARSDDDSKIVHRDVNAISSANSTTTNANRRAIGRFMRFSSFELLQFEAVDERDRVRFRPQRVVEQLVAPRRRKRRRAYP